MRVLPLISLSLLACIASADRLIEIPTGRKLRSGTGRIEHLWRQTDLQDSRTYLGYGVNESVELELSHDRFRSGDERTAIDLSYQYYPAFVDQSPAIRFGVRDLGNATDRGNQLYIAATYLFSLDGELSSSQRGEFTMGAMTGGRHSIFAGVSLPFSEKFRLMAEHDSRRITAGVEVRPIEQLGIRWLFRQDATLLGLSWTQRL